MNKKETIEKISELSQVAYSDCEKVLDALETVLSSELTSSKGANSIFDKIYKIMGVLKGKATILLLCLLCSITALAQQPTQNIRGIVTDRSSGQPLAFVAVGLTDLPALGTTTDDNGQFVLKNIPTGRYTIKATMMGHESVLVPEVLVTSSKEVFLEISMKENVQELGEIVVTHQNNKAEALNKMALTGARTLSVEEGNRYGGSLGDPARIVSAFAGVAPGTGSNGISVHGNAPSLLQWKLEDVEIPNPNHMADVATLGGGILTSLSGNVLGNSDFFTSAFPAEYNNAISGVFDMKQRNGNNQNYEHTFKAGVLGIDFASEGPFSKKHNASYLINYRFSTTSLLPMDEIIDFQDLNFRLNFPTKNAGIFSVWATALKDKYRVDEKPEDWKYKGDEMDSKMEQTSAAGGLTHRYFFGDALLKTTLAATYLENEVSQETYDDNQMINKAPYIDFGNKFTNLVLTSSFNKKYSVKHTNKTGFTVTNMRYDMNQKLAPFFNKPLETISEGKGNTNLIAIYTSSLFNFNDNVSATLGINGQMLTLNNNWTIEPRASVRWQSSSKSSFSIAYGLHSRMEKMDVYFVKTKTTGDKLVNKDLDFTKSHHISLAYNYKIADDMNLKIEPYFQLLFDVPVIADSSYSVLNRSTFYVEDMLVNKGKGRNYGIDVTLEKYMTRGLYYMVSASVFNSKYAGGDGVWHNTKFNRNFILTGLIGKEWMMGSNKQNVLGVNLRLTLQGGDRYSPVDEQATLAHPDLEVQYDETRAYSKQLTPILLTNYTINFRINRTKISHEFAIEQINATGYKEYHGHGYNLKTGIIEPIRQKMTLPNISYRIDF